MKEGMEDWTLENWESGPQRRLTIFIILYILGGFVITMVPLNYLMMPALGLTAWLNDYF